MLEGFKSNINTFQEINISADKCFDVLTDIEKQELLKSKMEIEFKAGETIIKKGFVASNILYIEEGLVRIDIETDKQSTTVNILPPKHFIGIICSFASLNFDFSAVALEKTTISLFNIKLFEKFIQQNGKFAFNFVRHLSFLSKNTIHRIARLSQKNIYGAVAILLCDFSKIYNSDSFTLPMNRKEMANIFGYSKESVINTLSKLNKDGILNVNDKKIVILDKKKLIQIGERG
ncbi:MAG: Crp/Fnr family transcriptional regulator [Bacteroidetes bacterium]|nr:Crp/Fnr family transcriptional regulator [Bacteroidota bacterium]